MTVIGDAFVAIHPDSSGFASKLKTGLAGINLSGEGALIGGTVVAGLVVGLAKIGQAFGSARVQIQRETGATGDELAHTFDTVKSVFAEVPASLKDVTTAVDELRRRGVPLGATFDTLAKQTLELAHITGSDLATTVESTTGLMNKYNVALHDQPAALDAIFKATQQSGRSLTDLTSALQSGGAVFTQFGLDISHSAALVAVLEKAAVNVQPALAGLKKAFGTITKEGGDPKAELAALFKEFTDGTPKAKAASDAIKLFGARSGAELVTALQQGKLDTKAMFDIITNGKGGIEATALATRTFSEELTILKNSALVALQPLASQVWVTIRSALVALVDPGKELAAAIAHLADAAGAVLIPLGALFALGFEGFVGLLTAFARGVETVASVLGHVPGPVLEVVGALVILDQVITRFLEAGGLSGIAAGFADLNPVVAGLVVAAAAVTALGVVMTIFGGKSSEAEKQAKSLSNALFGSVKSAEDLGAAVAGLSKNFDAYALAQDGLVKTSPAILAGLGETGLSVEDLRKALEGTDAQFDKFKGTLANVKLDEAAEKFKDASEGARIYAFETGQLTAAEFEQISLQGKVGDQLDTLRQQFKDTAAAKLQFLAAGGSLSASQLSDILGRLQAGTISASQALQEGTRDAAAYTAAQDKIALASATASGGVAQLRQGVLAGTVGTNDAADAAARFGVSLDDAKKIISDTDAALKQFVQQGLAGLGSSTGPIDDWQKGVVDAFTKVADASGKGPKAVAEAQKALVAATDPQQVIDNLVKEARSIEQFQGNIQTLLARGLTAAAQALLSDPNKEAAAALASKLVDNDLIATKFNQAENLLSQKTGQMSQFLSGPGAAQLLGGAAAAGDAISSGITAHAHIAAPVSAQVQGALRSLQQQEAFARAAGDTGSAATLAMQQRLILTNIAQTQTSGASAAIQAGAGPIAAAAGTAGTNAGAGFQGGLGLADKTKAAIIDAKGQWSADGTIQTAHEARAAGTEVGAGFVNGITAQIGSSTFQLRAAGATAARRVKEGADSVFRPGSPSRLGREMGQNFIDGVALGIVTTSSGEIAAASAARSISTAFANTSVALFAPGDAATLRSAGEELKRLLAIEGEQVSATGTITDARQAFQSFIQTAVSGLPTAQTAIQAFGAALSQAMSDVTSTGTAVAKAQAKMAKDAAALAGTTALASQKLFADVAHGAPLAQIFKDQAAIDKARAAERKAAFENEDAFTKANTAHIEAQQARDRASSPAAFILNVQRSTAAGIKFQNDLRTLSKSFPLLAAELAKAGPATAKGLADAFAAAPSRARIAEASLASAQTFQTNFTSFLTKQFADNPDVVGAGHSVGAQIVQGASEAINAQGDVVFSQLAAFASRQKLTVPVVAQVTAAPSSAVIAPQSVPVAQAQSVTAGITTLEIELTTLAADGSTVVRTATVPVVRTTATKATAKADMTGKSRA